MVPPLKKDLHLAFLASRRVKMTSPCKPAKSSRRNYSHHRRTRAHAHTLRMTPQCSARQQHPRKGHNTTKVKCLFIPHKNRANLFQASETHREWTLHNLTGLPSQLNRHGVQNPHFCGKASKIVIFRFVGCPLGRYGFCLGLRSTPPAGS